MDSPTLSIPSPTNSEVILEDALLKKGARGQFWHKRYFVFTADNKLLYYKDRGDPKPKGSYDINKLAECEISELYVDKYQKDLIYCFKLTWAADVDAVDIYEEESQFQSESWSVGCRSDSIVMPAIDDESQTAVRSQTEQQDAPSASSRKMSFIRRPPLLRRHVRRQTTGQVDDSSRSPPQRKRSGTEDAGCMSITSGGQRSIMSEGRSVDRESLTIGSHRGKGMRRDSAASADHRPKIPSLVQVDKQHGISVTPSQGGSVSTAPIANRAHRTTYERQRNEEQEYLRAQYMANAKDNRRKAKRKLVQRTKIAVAAGATVGVAVATAAIGLVAGMVVLGIGAAAGGGSAAVGTTWKRKKRGEIIIASPDYEKIRAWKACLDACLESNSLRQSKWGQMFVSEGRRSRIALFRKDRQDRSLSPVQDARQRTVLFEINAKWRPLEGGWISFLGSGAQGLRIFREEREDYPAPRTAAHHVRRILTKLSVEGPPCSPMKAHTVLNTSPLDAFLCLMSYGRVKEKPDSLLNPNSGQRASFRVIERIDDNTDVIHLMFHPLYLFPSWTVARDFVLYRYWRVEPDGSYVVCYESISHSDCPPRSGFVRGDMHQVFTIAPHKKRYRNHRHGPTQIPNECFMTAVVQVDPKGWVPVASLPFLSNQAYGDAFGISALLQLLDIKDAIDEDRFVPVALESDTPSHLRTRSYDFHDAPPAIQRNFSVDSADETIIDDPLNYDFNFAGRESVSFMVHTATGLASRPSPLPIDKWAEPDANSFRIRGKNYNRDKKKFNAGEPIANLIAVDVCLVDQPLYSGFTTHPNERIQLALKREKGLKAKGLPSDMPPFVFVVNIVVPGPPIYHGVFYYAIDDMSTIDGSDGTPSSKLCNEFFFGDSDAFRDETFKMIPQIIQGNFIVRKAVGSTPAIMGKKLRQLYVKTDRSFEVILDCGSSSVATGVIRLSLGYAKTLVIDLGFLLEGKDGSVLPERILGCARIKNMEFGAHLRKVEPPPASASDLSVTNHHKNK